MVFEPAVAAVNTVLSLLVLIYVAFYLYLWKYNPHGGFDVIRNPYFTLTGMAFFAVSNLLLVLYVFNQLNSLQPSLILNFVALAAIFIALYTKIKRTAYEHAGKGKKSSKR